VGDGNDDQDDAELVVRRGADLTLSSLVHKGLMVFCLSAVRNAAQTDIGHTERDRRRWEMAVASYMQRGPER
jgi:hypothetical protein